MYNVVEHAVGSQGHEQQGILGATERDWTGRRKAKPAEFLFPTTMRWMATLPPEFQPTATAECFPRIANALARLWSTPEESTSYFSELMVDKRVRRLGFPVRVLGELDGLRAYYAMLHPDRCSRSAFPANRAPHARSA